MYRRMFMSLGMALIWAPLVFSGAPHFTTCSQVVDDTTLLAEGKEAGLGNETQVQIELTATALCINPGGQDPKAANKETVSTAGTFPVQNGKALFSLELEATFRPSCSPPMTVLFEDIAICDPVHAVCCTF